MPETPQLKVPADSMPAAPNGMSLLGGGGGAKGHQRSPSKLALTTDGAAVRRGVADFDVGLDDENGATLSTEEKQELLGRHLSSVEDLVKDLRHCTPFGGVVC